MTGSPAPERSVASRDRGPAKHGGSRRDGGAGARASAAGRRRRWVLRLVVVLPLAAAVAVAVVRLGAAYGRVAELDAVAAAERALDVYYAERMRREAAGAGAAAANAAVTGAFPTRASAFLDTLAAAGWDGALYVAGRRIASTAPAFGPDTLTIALRDALASLDRAFAATLPGGRPGAIAPVKDRDRWDVVGTLMVASRAPAPPAIPGGPLAAGVVALLLTLAACAGYARHARGASDARDASDTRGTRGATPAWAAPGAGAGSGEDAGVADPASTARRRGSLAGALAALVFAPAVVYAGYLHRLGDALPAPEVARDYRLWLAIAFGTWAVTAAVGLSLARTAERRLRLREALAAWGFLAPSFLHLLLFSVGPIAFALLLSFHEWNLIEAARPFVGLDNYRALLEDAPFWRSVLNTAVYVLFVPVGMIVALALALLVDRRFRGVRFLRTALFLPYVTSFVAISLVWKWMYQPDFGLFNTVLRTLGLPASPWLTSPTTALPSLMLMSVWMYAGYMMVIFLAGLQNIPDALHESARIDGAGAWQRFRRITLPLLRPTTFFVLVTMVIFSFQVFTAVYVMTEGGPLHATDVVVYHIYRNAWEYLRMGYASAMAWVLFAVVFVLTMAQWRWLGGRKTYE